VAETGSPQRKVSVGYQEERLVTNPNVLSNIDRRNILQQSNSLKQLHEDLLASLPYRCKGNDLIAFLITNQKSSNKVQGQAILNAMVEAGFIQLVSYYDGSSPGQIPVDPPQILEFNENEFYEIQKFEDVVVSPEKNPRKMSSIRESAPRDDYKNEELQNSLNATGSRPLLEPYCEHEEALLNQLLRNNNLDLSWSKVLIPLCSRISLLLHPKFSRSDSMDIRNFVNMKKVSGGTRDECAIYGGTVCSKNVAHKNMKVRIENPRILLLQCAIAYHRVEGKFVSIETLLLQEKEYLRNVISR
jgi:1-phosphatidylinositol-3-phosphate 5-kinase